MRKIVESLPNYHTRVPDQSFILSDTNEPADGEPAGDRLLGGTRGDGWALVYLPYGGDVSLDLAKAIPAGGQWRAWWINPRDGGRLSFLSGNDASDDGQRAFSAPSGGNLKNDWLLYIDTESAANPWPLEM